MPILVAVTLSVLVKLNSSNEFKNICVLTNKLLLFPDKVIINGDSTYKYSKLNYFRFIKIKYAFIPKILFFHFCCFHYPDKIKSNNSFQNNYLNFQKERKEIVDAHLNFLIKNKIDYSERSYNGIRLSVDSGKKKVKSYIKYTWLFLSNKFYRLK